MTKETAKDYLPLVQALAEGKTIQRRVPHGWSDYSPHNEVQFDGPPQNYRVKPEPRVIWVNEYEHGIFAYSTKELAGKYAVGTPLQACLKFVEVPHA